MSSLIEMEPYSLPISEAGKARGEPSENPRDVNLLHLAWRGRWLIVLCMLLGGAAGSAMLLRVTPLYSSESRIYVERNLPRVLAIDAPVGHSANYHYTQAEAIRSTSVLAAAVQAPENADLKCFEGVDNRVALLRQALTVTVGSQDDIINISAQLPDRNDAAQLVNSVVDAYVTKYVEQRRNETVDILEILRKDKERRDEELSERRTALEEFRNANPELAIQIDSENVVTRRFSALSEELNQTELALLDAKARYARAKNMYEAPGQRPYLLDIASHSQHGPREFDRESQIEQLERSLTTERAKWGEGHPRVRLLRESLEGARQRMKQQQHEMVEAFVDNVRQEYELQLQKRNELRANYDEQYRLASEVSSKALQLASLVDALQRAGESSDLIDERIKDVNLREDVGAMNVSIMEVATASSDPSYPVRSRFLAAGILLGGLTGFGLAWLRDRLDHRLRSVDEIASVLQLPVLGALPYLGDRQDRAQSGRLVTLAPRSLAAESVRTLRTALHFGIAGPDAKVILVTSPSAGDGKSTVASNLAIAMAQADQRVLLIDADMRKPIQQLTFHVDQKRGLGSVLAERQPVEDAIIPAVADSLDLLPSGPLPSNPVELLNNGYFAELLEKLKERYDKIVIDSPPVMPIADARVIAALSDATILVLRAERSTRRACVAARNELWRVRATRLGVVINGVPLRKQGNYGYGEYGYASYGYSRDRVSGQGRGSRSALPARQPAATTSAAVEL